MSSAKKESRFKLTTASGREGCHAPQEKDRTASGRPAHYHFYWDTELRGFALVVGVRTRTFVVQKDVRGRSVRVTIGRLGAWTVEQARKRARELIVQMDTGVNPNETERQ